MGANAYSVGTRSGRLDHLAPLGDFGLDEGAELLRRIAAELAAVTRQLFLHFRQREHAHDFCVELADDGPRTARLRAKHKI